MIFVLPAGQIFSRHHLRHLPTAFPAIRRRRYHPLHRKRIPDRPEPFRVSFVILYFSGTTKFISLSNPEASLVHAFRQAASAGQDTGKNQDQHNRQIMLPSDDGHDLFDHSSAPDSSRFFQYPALQQLYSQVSSHRISTINEFNKTTFSSVTEI